ncbi:cell wall-binding repeat-containing protein, partial [Peptostreptococcus faecalis]|uniref:cell wall-binding repeat-containing protein n=1 Tax=Peptostreptococcus faecalis TaxID=2045015 RepID=UPI0015E0A2CF
MKRIFYLSVLLFSMVFYFGNDNIYANSTSDSTPILKSDNLNKIEVSNFEDLKDAIESESYDEIVIMNDIEITEPIEITESVIISGGKENKVVLTGKLENGETMFTVEGSTLNTATFNNIVLDGNNINGAVRIPNGQNLSIKNSSVVNSRGGYYGAIEIDGECELNIVDSEFKNNLASNFYGGAVYFNNFTGNVNIFKTAFKENSAKYGGALAFTNSSNKVNLKMNEVTFEKNTALGSSGSMGGALYIDKSPLNIVLNDTNFIENSAKDFASGGAIIIRYSDEVKLELNNNKFIKNTSQYGGGIYIERSFYSNININKTLFEENEAFIDKWQTSMGKSSFGGAFSIMVAKNSNVLIKDSSFIRNKAYTSYTAENGEFKNDGHGGAIDTVVDTEIINSIFDGNYAGTNGGAIAVFKRDKSMDIISDEYADGYYNPLKITDTSFSNNVAGNGFYVLDEKEYPLTYGIYTKNILNTKSLSNPAQLGKNIAYNNYDISFLSNKELIAVTFEPEGGKFTDNSTNKKVVEISKGEKVAEEKISREGYTFEGWYLDKNGKDKFDFNTAINSNTTLYAKWKKNDVPVTPPGGGGGGGTINPPTKRATAVLASGKKYTDVLTATVLASERDCPILLTDTNDITTETFNELKRRGIGDVIISGGPDSVSQKVVDQLKDFNVIRYAGSDRYGTAREIGKEVRALTGKTDGAMLVDGTNFPDVITISALATQKRVPILITNPNKLTTTTENVIKDWKLSNIVIGGSTDSVAKNIQDRLN